MYEKRTKVFYLPQRDLIGILNGLAKFEYLQVPLDGYACDGWPADAVVEAVWYEPTRQGFGILIWSSEFDVVPDGQHSPDAQAEPIRWGLLKRRSMLETHEPGNAETAALVERKQASWREQEPLL